VGAFRCGGECWIAGHGCRPLTAGQWECWGGGAIRCGGHGECRAWVPSVAVGSGSAGGWVPRAVVGSEGALEMDAAVPAAVGGGGAGVTCPTGTRGQWGCGEGGVPPGAGGQRGAGDGCRKPQRAASYGDERRKLQM
jgi:hypothetical protein